MPARNFHRVCVWCHEPFMGYYSDQKFCCNEHGASYRQKLQHIFKQFTFQHERIDTESAKLAKQGKNYILPPRVV